ncbi:MAG: ABC transporter permease [Pseudomonadota bacterium]
MAKPKQTSGAELEELVFDAAGSGDAGSGKSSKPSPDDFAGRSQTSIVPPESVAGRALTLVVAIMAFLACLTLGAVTLVSGTASKWQSDIAREITIQIRPVDGVDIVKSLADAQALARGTPGIEDAVVVGEQETARLLEPWLGTGLDLNDLPVPRLVTVFVSEGGRPDFAALRSQLADKVPGASLDDHRSWVDRLTTMARATVAVGIAVFALVVVATVLTVVFATRGAMAGNRNVIEVLHFVGAERGYIARQFQNHFMLLGLKGAFAGGVFAMIVFAIAGFWAANNIATPEADQMIALFGTFTVGLYGYAGALVLMFAIAILTAMTSRWTVLRHVGTLDRSQDVG